MLIIGLNYHPSFQQIAFVDTESGECGERRLMHDKQEAANFYRELKERGRQRTSGDGGHWARTLV
jgi:transposase